MDNRALIAKAQEYCVLEQDEFFRSQVEELIARNDLRELTDRFFTDLEFGTGGLRGLIGGGYNRMNSYIVKRATRGLAAYIQKNTAAPICPSAVIAYDSRNFSEVFSLTAALVLCANGIRTYLFSSLRPTPELSYAVRHLQTTAGIVITASHNPPEYNGYKVYWSDGGQVVPPHDTGIIAEVRAVSGAIPEMNKDEALAQGLLIMIDKEIDEPFISMVTGQCLRPHLVREKGKKLTVVFTPLHGAGAMPVKKALADLGFPLTIVPQQELPDGNFPTVSYPNPEEPSAMHLALELGKKIKADLVMGTDPDADRIGIAAPDDGDLRLITGNELGALLLDYILSTRKELGTLPENGVFIKTIVTSELQRLIAETYGVTCLDVLTGFKYIGEKIREFERAPGNPTFLFGGEESYGYLTSARVRDKDAVSSAVMAAEMTLFHQSNGKTLFDRLRELWLRHGFFKEVGIAGAFKGQEGLASMNRLMDSLRNNPPATFAGRNVISLKDYRNGTTLYLNDHSRRNDIDLPSSNVLQFFLVDGSIVTARPSGTEPKIKFYVSCRSPAGTALDIALKDAQEKIKAIGVQIKELIDKAIMHA
ncbi:MAG: phospho-sugar mutase [Chitinispirillaceae bacterium]|nr:phospho-sugar mutase [Chitinispirillaceae bacterium]